LIIPIIFSQIADLIKQFGEQGDEGKNGIMKDFLSLIVTMGICNLIRLGFTFASARISDLLTSKSLSTMYRESITYIYQNSYRFFTENPSGGILSKIEKFADAYPSFLYVLFDQLISLIILLPGIIIVMVRENMWLGLIFVAYTMIWIGVQLLLNKKQDTLSAKESEERSKKTAYLADTLSNSFNMLSFASQKKEEKKLLDIVESRRKDRFNKNFFFTKARISRNSINIFFKLGIFALGVKFWEIGWIEIATILLVRNYTENLESRLFYLAGMFREISRIFGDSKEMIEIFNTPYEIVDKTQKKLTIPH
jgi:ABC-type multidrug transport system fused ATPase/permease subunit